MVTTIILSSLLGVFVIISVVFYLKLRKNKTVIGTLSSQLQTLKMQTQYRFEEDVAFLSYIAGFKCKVYKDLVLTPSTELSDTKFLKGEDQEEAIREIVLSIYNSLSDDYVKVLLKYFSPESLEEYIIELVLNQITSIITDLNAKKLRSFIKVTPKDTEVTFKKKDIE